MKYRIEDNRLVITVTPKEQEGLRTLRHNYPDEFGTDAAMQVVLAMFTHHECYFWVDPSDTGDLTSAPILALFGEEEVGPAPDEAKGKGLFLVGHFPAEPGQPVEYHYYPITHRWAFMDYQVTTPQEQLLERGEATFTGGRLLERPDTDLRGGEENFGELAFADMGL